MILNFPFLHRFNPNYIYGPPKSSRKPQFETYCRARLLQFKPGANFDNLLDTADPDIKFADYQEALANFIENSVHCPSLVKEQFNDALLKSLKDAPDEDEELNAGEDEDDFEFPDLYIPEMDGVEVDREQDKELTEYLQGLMGEKGIEHEFDGVDDEGSDYEDDEGIINDCKTHDWNASWHEQGWTQEKLKVILP